MNAGEIATALSDGAMLCAKVARTDTGSSIGWSRAAAVCHRAWGAG